MKRTTSLVALAAASALLLAGCSAGNSNQKELDENRVILYNIGPNDSLDPVTPVNANGFAQAALMSVYDRLVAFDETGQLVPGLAESWEFTNDQLTEFQLKLRKGVTFHDGTPLDAAAVVANLERTKGLAETASPVVKDVALSIASVEAVDDATVKITLTKPRGALPYDLGAQAGMMMSPASFANGETGDAIAGVGTGPFVVEETVPNQYTKMAEYADYWNGGTDTRADFFEVHYVSDAQTRLNALRSGQADIVTIETPQVAQAKAAKLEVTALDGTGVWMSYLNISGELADQRVREALQYAIDKKALAENLSGGTAQVTNQIFPAGYPTFDEDSADLYDYDPAKAKKLLAEAGYPNGLTLDFVQLNMAEVMSVFEALQQMWSEVGITMNVTTIDVSQFGSFVDGSLGDLMLAGWGGRADPRTTIAMLAGTGGTYAPGGTVDPKIDELLAEASALAPGDERRAEALREANTIATEKVATLPFMTRPVVYATQPDCIGGLNPYPAIPSGDWQSITKNDACR